MCHGQEQRDQLEESTKLGKQAGAVGGAGAVKEETQPQGPNSRTQGDCSWSRLQAISGYATTTRNQGE